jgi:enamine deaminase RidA (YjgF/YER057c/UK114 family)
VSLPSPLFLAGAFAVMIRHRTCNPYEQEFGYSRAVRRGPFVFVSGTTSIDPDTGEILHPTSAYHQAIRIFQEIITAVEAVGGNKTDIVRVRMFVTAQEDAGGVGRALKEVFGDIEPAATMIIGAKFVAPKMLVEIEADAVILCEIDRNPFCLV